MCQRFEDEVLLLGWRRLYPRASVPAILGFETEAADRMRACAARQGIGLVDLAREMSGRKKYFADFVHFTDEGAGKWPHCWRSSSCQLRRRAACPLAWAASTNRLRTS